MTETDDINSPARILHVITRMEEGGAPRVLLSLLDGLDPDAFVQEVATGAAPKAGDITGELEPRRRVSSDPVDDTPPGPPEGYGRSGGPPSLDASG